MKATRAVFLAQLVSFLKTVAADDSSMVAWHAYGTIINGWLNGGAAMRPGIDYVFVTPPTVATIPAGSPIPVQVTNEFLFHVADTLQLPDAPIWQTTSDSYTKELDAYLSAAVYPGTEPTADQQAHLTALKAAQKTASDAWQAERIAAIAAYNADPIATMTHQSFANWVIDNWPEYAQAKSALDSAKALVNAYDRSINSPAGKVLDASITNLEQKGLVVDSSFPGYNMPVYSADDNYPVTPFQVNQVQDPTQIYYQPAYTIPNYVGVANGWLQGQNLGSTSATLSLATTSSSNWTDLGHSSSVTRGSAGGGFLSFLSASYTHTTDTVEFQSNTSTFTQSVNVTVTLTNPPQVFSLSPGLWDVPNARSLYPTLLPNNTDGLVGKIRAQKILIGYGVGLQMSFSDLTTYNNVKTFVQTAQTTAGGGLSIFGFHFGASYNSQYTRNMSDIQMGSTPNGGYLNIAPTPPGVFCMLGAYGVKF